MILIKLFYFKINFHKFAFNDQNFMASKTEVEVFLENFKAKMQIWDIIFLDERTKNAQTLLQLEITTVQRKKIISDLVYTDYSEGPLTDKQFWGDGLWVFGKAIKQQQLYIKISLGKPGKQTICISFHIAEHPIKLPFQTNNK